MTRETRIALLVGLAFIVLFGLVLGQRSLDLSAASAEDSASGEAPARPGPQPSPELAMARFHEQDDRPVLAPPAPAPQAPAAERPIPLIARRLVETQSEPPEPSADASKPAPPPVKPDPPARTYTVRPGDSLIKIARKVYGPRHERQYLRIFRANRDKLADAARLKVGQVLTIPPLPAASSASKPPAPAPGRRHYTEMTMGELAGRFGHARTYVVRSGDCLTDIARKTMGKGSAAAVRRLVAANRDRIQDPDRLVVGLKLRIPS